jgi:endonuclease/exonuclease/phosphatase family metal-dependent hydrolase
MAQERSQGTSVASLTAAGLVLALVLPACRTFTSHLDPRGPVYSGRYAGEPRVGPVFRVVTFNIEYALRVDRALVALRDHPRLRGADVVALQEMDAPGTDAIARGLGLNYVYYPVSVHPKWKRDVGNAVLTPWRIERSFKLPLPHRSRLVRQSRAAVGAVLEVGELRLRVYSLHLGSPFGVSPGQRREQLEVVLCDAREAAEPVIVAGDFNSSGIGARLVADGYAWLTRGVGPTTHGFSFDHVFARGLPFEEAAAGVAREVKDASDHRPVWAELRLRVP